MPRLLERGQALEAIESSIFVYLIESSSSEGKLEDIEELPITWESFYW